MNTHSISQIGQILTLIKPSGRALSFAVGEIIKAEVVKMVNDQAALRIGREIIQARTEIALTTGDVLTLKVVGLEDRLRLQLIAAAGKAAPHRGQTSEARMDPEAAPMPQKVLRFFSELSEAKLTTTELKAQAELVRSLPDKVKRLLPELRDIEKTLGAATELSGPVIREGVENSGVLLEAKLAAIAKATSSVSVAQVESPSEQILEKAITEDLKALLLKTKENLEDETVRESFGRTGMKPEQVGTVIDRLLRNIEYFQASSKLNDMLYTFLPVVWQELRDGEAFFQKDRGKHGMPDTYYCTLNLDLERLGRMSIAVTMQGSSFFASFKVADKRTCSLVNESKGCLEERFAGAGMDLKSVTIVNDEVSMGDHKKPGLKVRA